MKQNLMGHPPAVLLVNPKYPHNVGSILRSCSCFGIRQLWWTGDRVTIDPVLGERLPREERMKGYKDVEMCPHDRPLDFFDDVSPVCVELSRGAELLTTFEHPDNALYIFGPEDGGISRVWKQHCHRFVVIPSNHCLNLATAVAIVLSHRRMSRQLLGKEKTLPMCDILREHRGAVGATPELFGRSALQQIGWDGK